MKKCVSLKRHSQASVDGCGKLVMWQWFHWPIWLQHAMCYSCHPMSSLAGSADGESEDDVRSMILFPTSEKAVVFPCFSLTFWKPLIFFSAETAVRKAFRECENRGSRDLANMQAAKSCPFLPPFLVKWQKTKTSRCLIWIFFVFFLAFFQCIRKKGETWWLLQHLPLFPDRKKVEVFYLMVDGWFDLILRILSGQTWSFAASQRCAAWSYELVAESFHFWWSSKYVQISFWFRGIFFGPEDPGPPPPFKPEVRLARKWEQTLNQRERFGPPRTVGWCIVMVSVYRM